MKKDEFKCAVCNGIFKKGWTNEEAVEECKNTFGEGAVNADDNCLICDDCYNLSPFLNKLKEEIKKTKS